MDTKEEIKYFKNQIFTFDGEFKEDQEGKEYNSEWTITDPQKAVERLQSLSDKDLEVNYFRDGGSVSVETPTEVVYFRIKHNKMYGRKYYPYALKKEKGGK